MSASQKLSGTAWIGDMSDAEYFADPCEEPALSSSIGKLLVNQSPLHAWHSHPRLGGTPGEATRALTWGTVMHAYLLGTDKSCFVTLPEHIDSYRSAEAKALKGEALAAGKTPILHHQALEYVAAYGRLLEATANKGLDLQAGTREQVIIWEETASNGRVVQCKGKIDNWQEPIVTDLKTSHDVSPDAIQRSVAKYGYDIQEAAYVSGVEAVYPELAGRVEYQWVFVESGAVPAVTRARPSALQRQIGRIKWRKAIDLWGECLESGIFPDYETQELVIEPAPWEANKIMMELEAMSEKEAAA